MDFEVYELGFKHPFYYDVFDGKPFTFTGENRRVGIQIQMMMIFLKSGGELWVLEDYWTQVVVSTVQCAAVADFR